MQDNFEISKEFNLPQEETKKMKLNKNLVAFMGIGIVALLVLGFFGYQYLAPFGSKVIYQFNQAQDKDKVSKLIGAESSESINNNAVGTLTIPEQTIRGNIVTFNLGLLSKKIDGVWVNLKFKGDPKDLKIGVKGELKGKYTYQPLYQQFLESIKPERFSDLLFWQKNKQFKSFADFLKNPSQDKIIATYNFDPTEIYSYKSSDLLAGEFTSNKLLRGTHELLINVSKAPLTISVKKQDQNIYKGVDVLSVEVYRDKTLIGKKEIPDDDIVDATGLMLQPQETKLELKDVKPGVYKLLLLDKSKGGDVRISSISINQKNVVFNSPIYIVDSKKTGLFTTSSQISVITFHEQGLQTLRINSSKDFKIAKIGEPYKINLNEGAGQNQATSTSKLNQIDIPKNDLIISGDGYFTFDKNSFFNPNPLNSIDLADVADISSIDYVIARYQKVKKEGDLKTAQVYFDPKDINIEKDKLYFSLESPGLAQSGGEITISSLEVTVDKPGWFNNKEISDKGQRTNDKSFGKAQDKGLMMNTWNTITSPFVAGYKVVTGFFGGIWDSTTGFFTNLWPFGSNDNKQPAVSNKPSEAPTDTPTPTPVLKDKLKITVQNGGAAVGAATKYADLLKKEGFKNVDPITIAKTDYKDATILYNKDEEKNLEETIGEIKKVLESEYKTINTDFQPDKESITIILGTLLKPTPTATSVASPSAR